MRRRVTFSRNFTLSLSRTCRCYCKYCAFATHRAHLHEPDEVLAQLQRARRRNAKELLVLTGERPDINDGVRERLRALGHEVTGRAVSLGEVAAEVAGEQPDLAVVAVHDSDDHALALISEITEVAGRPVIALLGEVDPGFVRAAAERGIFAYARSDDPANLQGAIEVALQRFHEARAL
ncbi:MAG: hypothetical protein KY462_16935, partial [Actinobacteria bacterium]|nr:hypothetical protein [Actinomycetota bacterium]